ncbi:MAG TPA: RNA-binding domain-containing protein [Methanomassiliicoccales archaeon]|jgi:predicted RNA binding protein with dsRBD fold (UPF0201 family)|nr:RNA-binding domain-containing protein [Methanomassiliicoccales archaeon]
MPLITARVRLFSTEDPDKVRRALLNVFPDALVEEYEGGLIARSGSLARFKELIHNQRIRDSTRSVLLRSASGSEMRFQLNKQVAYVGKISFTEGPMPLGSIEVSIEADDIASVIDEVAPATIGGEEVGT